MLQRQHPRLVLASASESRRALLAAAGIAFDVRPADIDEARIKREARSEGRTVEETALRLADAKAAAVARAEPGAVVIGADQILACAGCWFDKPADVATARQQLMALRGASHILATAVVCHENGRRVWQDLTVPRLVMRRFSEAFLDAYLTAEADQVTRSVGGYRLEGYGAQLFDAVEGDHSAILGLPLLPLLSFLRERGILVG
jgi:septum formation protein